MNNRGPFSTDFIGGSCGYPDANYQERELIWNNHERYIRGFFYALQHHPDPRVPNGLRRRMRQFGLDRLNFGDPEKGDEKYWPYQLYVRESRRMVSDVVWSGADLSPETADLRHDSRVIASTLYRADSHHGQRFAEQGADRWFIWNEGGFERRIGVASRAPIPYDIIVPRRQECTNLLIGFCVSATHEAFSAIRMEPTLMTIGEAIGVAAAIIREQPALAVQDVPYDRLRARLSVSKIAPVLPTWSDLMNEEASADRRFLLEKSVLHSLVGRKVVSEGRIPNDVSTFNNLILSRESVVPLLDRGPTPGEVRPAGRFRVGRWRRKLVVAGTVKASEREVYIAINGRIIRVVNTSASRGQPQGNFKFAFGASVLGLLPPNAFVSVSSRGGLLASEMGGWSWPLIRSKGTGAIFDRLKQGWTIDKWGQIALPISEKPAWRQAVLEAYQRFAYYAENRFDKKMYFVAGTLLGAVREGNFIAHDDDMDVGYFSNHTKAENVRDEMFEMIRRIRADNWRLRIAHNRGFFQIFAGVGDAKFDVFPAWHEGGYIWMHNSQRIPAPPEMMIPPRCAPFLGRSVLFPNQPEAYLAHHYGPTWRVPDKHYQETKQPGVLEGLRRARLTPSQIASLQSTAGEGNKSMILNDGKLPLVWWNQTSNFGDLLSPWLARKISGKDVVYADRAKPHYLAVGSILDKANDNSIIWGSGSFGTERRNNMPKGATYLATRGPLTRNRIDTAKLRCPRIYGDPALLVPRYYPRTKEPSHELGLIVRWSETNLREGINVEGVKLIDFARSDVEAVIDDILSCKRVFSSSLHGLILADAYGIPNAWKVSNSPKGREFKFWDYFISVGKLRHPSTFKLLRPDLTLSMMLDGIEFDGRPIDIDLEALLAACPFRA
jgi:pyruvyltransferase